MSTNLSNLSTSEFLRLEENLVSTELKVANPTFLKTGVLGALINSLAIIKSDNANFMNTLIKEASPATADSYKALFFHSTVKQINVEFSTPSTFNVSFIIPEVDLTAGQVIKYSIGRETQLMDENGYGYTLEDPVEIYMTHGSVRGRRYNSDSIEDLDVYRIVHPYDSSQYIYLVNTEVKQYDRKFKLVTIPDLGEDGYTINFEIPSIEKIYQINAWRQLAPTSGAYAYNPKNIDLNSLRSIKTQDFATIYELIPLDIKYTKSLSNQTDNHIFASFNNTSISFLTGDGIYGRKPKENEKILIELKTTEGVYGNLPSTQFSISDILVQEINSDGTINQKNTTLKAVSTTGGQGGNNLENKEDLRRKLLNTRGNYIGCIADIKNEFYLDAGVPFIDKKYFNSKHNIFIYNIIRDKAKKIIPTTTKNLKLTELENNPFLPEIVYDGLELISPFYYVNFQNKIKAYLILPEVKIDLIPEAGTSENVKLENSPNLYLTYNWFERKTYLELRSINVNYEYEMTCNINQSLRFSAGNNFRLEVNKTFLNEWCLLDGFQKDAYNPGDNEVIKVPGYLENITLTIYNNTIASGVANYIIRYIQANGIKYQQTILKQEHYYWIDVDLFDSTKKTTYVLNIPFIEKKFITNDVVYAATKLDGFFTVNNKHERINPNLSLTQAFYNTIKIEDIYRNYIFETTDVFVEPLISINLELILSSINLQRSKWLSTSTLEIDLKWIIQDYVDYIEGYKLEFNESKLEQKILNYFNIDYNVIENIKIWNPSGPIRVRDSSVIYSLFEENFGSADIDLTQTELQNKVRNGELPQVTQKQIVDFVPPYFSFSSNINITFKIDNQ